MRRALVFMLWLMNKFVMIDSFTFSKKHNLIESQLQSKPEKKISRRRAMLSIYSSFILTKSLDAANAAERAVGSAERECRNRGDCLQIGDLDGAIGWNWGAKDRCDAADPKCGVNGQENLEASTLPLPSLSEDLTITKRIEMEIRIGRNESGIITFGLYGDACPESVEQFLQFCSTKGIVTDEALLQSYTNIVSSPVSFAKSGSLHAIYPGEKVDFGVLSQETSFSRRTGYSKKYKNAALFTPQPRPSSNIANVIKAETSPRLLNIPGLVSIPSKGLGYADEEFLLGSTSIDDEAFSSGFQISSSSTENKKRKVIGQILDEQSMRVFTRLASLPTQKGLKGIVPGQNSGPPLVRVAISRVSILD